MGSRYLINMSYYEVNILRWIRGIPRNFNTKEACNEAICIEPLSLAYVPNSFKTQEMCNEAIEVYPWLLFDVPDHFKNKRMCEKKPLKMNQIP